MSRRLPSHLADLYKERRKEIGQRLQEFSRVAPQKWFYELCFCLMTPQSSAVHAHAVQLELERIKFFQHGQDVVHLLRDPATYIRFHNTKHKRLHLAREQWPSIEVILLDRGLGARERRDRLRYEVNGFGMKEASHYLRNIGHRGLAIIDRHLLTNLIACGVYDEPPAVNSDDRYREVEAAFESYCKGIGIDMDEIDLLFWCAQTGHILK